MKNSQLGKVKTRLAQSIGDREALNAYHKLLQHTKEIATPLQVEKSVWYSNYIEEEDIWDTSDFKKELQKGNDLGERMKAAFQLEFTKNKNSRIVLIGSDCGELDTLTLQRAFEALENNSLVIGPAKDGGYYLIGMTQLYPQILEGIEWSTDKVLEQTLDKVKEHNISYALLQKLNDVDTVEDWNLVKKRLK